MEEHSALGKKSGGKVKVEKEFRLKIVLSPYTLIQLILLISTG